MIATEIEEKKLSIPFCPGNIQLEQLLNQEEGINLLCPIDQVLLKDPCKLPCGHQFCKNCINRWLNTRKSCPVCRQEVEKGSVKLCEETAITLQSIVIRCGHTNCDWVGKLGQYEDSHIKTECKFQEVECPYGCDASPTRGGLKTHLTKCEFSDPKFVLKLKAALEDLQRQNLSIKEKISQHKALLMQEHKKATLVKEQASLVQPLLKEDTENILAYVKLAKDSEQYDDMRLLITEVVKRKTHMSVEVRNFFAFAYKNCMGKLRAALRNLIEEENSPGNTVDRVEEVLKLKTKTIIEIEAMAETVLGLLQENLFQRELSNEDKAFYLKMNADYLRFLAECAPAEECKKKGEKSREKYLEGIELANKTLKVYNSVRLGIILNYTVLLYEILEEKESALNLAKATFQEGVQAIDDMNEEDDKDIFMILQLMRDNIQLWTDENF